MGIVFAVRGDDMNARYSNAGKKAVTYRNNASAPEAAVASSSDTGVIGGSVIEAANTSYQVGFRYPGYENFSTTGAFSILVRHVPQYSGTPAQQMGLMNLIGPFNTGFLQFDHLTTGNLFARYAGEHSLNHFNTTMGSYSPTSGTANDIVLTWTGDTTSNGLKMYVDNTLNNETTALQTNNVTRSYWPAMIFGVAVASAQFGNSDFNEIVIWDEVIDPSSVTLTSGSGALNGSSRTAFVDVSSFDGTAGGGASYLSTGGITF